MSTGNGHGGVGSTIARHLLLTVILLAGFFTVVYVASLLQNPPIHYLGGRGFDLVTGELKDPADPNLRKAGLLFPSYVPHDLPLAGIIRAPHGVFYLLFDKIPLESGEFHLLDVMRKGGVVLLEETSTRTMEEQEAWVAYVIEETEGKVERVNVNGHVGSLGHGEIPQLRWWQNGLRLILFGFLLDDEFLAIAQSVQPV